ncbi:MAG: transposase [Candidatus Binatia bacterium]
MPRCPRLATGGIAYHVLNRRISRLPLFEKPGDYTSFEKILAEACERTNIRIAAYCLMPNHALCGAPHNIGICFCGRAGMGSSPR